MLKLSQLQWDACKAMLKELKWVMEFLENQNARYEDILITVDGSDVIVSDGNKYESVVEYFIKNTAENEENLIRRIWEK